ncbi:FHA domain-containing protein [Melittangium boletus]|uniref:Adenylate cyclase n=1 Tax=Melittangium boletus DSM 14713 TaxID=1294270 RepID=A0A250IJN1_9BACT|nr:FHA domain-containing protein [Melittangium boletus]ATB31402.1 adenylate cyclase [Melittangium boletus DSM 14713]
MSFQLTIAEGKEAGKEFVFELDSVLIGRVSECDVVLYDSGISRRHCRVFAEAGAYFAEDLGSSNGSRVNGQPIKPNGKQALVDGDQLTLGPVVFVFKRVAAMDENESTAPMPEAGGNSTRIVSVNAVARRQRNKGEALAPEGADEAQLGAAQRSATRAMPAIRRTGAQPALPEGAPPRASRASSGSAAALARASESAPTPSRRPASGAVARASRNAPGALSAAERARIRREAPGLVGNLKLFWLEASPPVRQGLIALGGLGVLALVGLLYWAVLGEEAKVMRGPEPKAFSSINSSEQIITDSFGLGDDVDWANGDQKTFEFEYTSATRTLALLHYQAQGISEGEVVVTINGVDLGKVPPDTLASQDRVLEIMIPWQLLKKGEVNRITFDNTRNPPGEDSWRIWNLWLERVPLPELSPEQMVEEATKAYKRGRKNLDTVNVGARNGYEAWKSFREAWLLLEVHPEPRPDLYYEAQERMREAQTLLDRVCSKLMLEVERYANQSNWEAASATLDHTRDYFPEKTGQICAQKAEMKREELGL